MPLATDLPIQSITALATVFVALITGAISFVNLVLTKEQKTSEFRQAWIDGLRNDIADFVAAARVFARAAEKAMLENNWAAFNQKENDLRHQAAKAFCKIKLRLNPDEDEHKELLRLIDRAIAEQTIMIEEKTDITATIKAIDIATDYARPVLKKEWVRVKEGESAFRTARNIAVIVVLVSILLLLFLLY